MNEYDHIVTNARWELARTAEQVIELIGGATRELAQLEDIGNRCLPFKGVVQKIREILVRHGQEQLLAGIEELDEKARKEFLSQLEEVDWAEEQHLYETVAKAKKKAEAITEFKFTIPILERRQEAAQEGDKILRWGAEEGKAKMGIIMMAGGTGSGLGYEHPKGMFPIMPLSADELYNTLMKRNRAAAAFLWSSGGLPNGHSPF